MVKTLRNKDDIGFTIMMKPLNSFNCNQARKRNRTPMRGLYKPTGATTSLLLMLCSDQIQRIEALITNLYQVVHYFSHHFVVISMVMFPLADSLV